MALSPHRFLYVHALSSGHAMPGGGGLASVFFNVNTTNILLEELCSSHLNPVFCSLRPYKTFPQLSRENTLKTRQPSSDGQTHTHSEHTG